MNLKKRNAHRLFKNNRVWLLLLAGPLLVSRLPGMPGIIANPTPEVPLVPAAMENDVTNNAMTVFVPNGTIVDQSLPQPFRYGPFTVRPHVDYNSVYGSGIQAAPTNHQTTAIQQISPGLALDLGTHWTLDYTPTIRLYSNSQFKDGVDHAVSLVGGTHYEDWTFGLSQGFVYTTAPDVETAGQTEQQNFTTALTAADVLNDKLSLNLGLNQDFNYAQNLQDSRDWSTMNWLNYTFWPRLTAGVGAGVGYLNVETGSDQPYENLQADVNWRATDKISIQVSGGLQVRQFLGATSQTYLVGVITNLSYVTINSSSDLITPIFNATIQYQPFQDTQISVNAGRSISPSLIPGSDTIDTSFGASINQTLFKKFALNLGASYSVSKFTQTGSVANTLPNNEIELALQDNGRSDDNYILTARLSHPFLRRGSWSVFYQYSDNQSTEAGFGYHGNQVGFDISYRY